jgi:hypothetical protein
MNRKKILLCLNGADDAQLESSFIERNLDHPHNLVVKFHLEGISPEEILEASTPSPRGVNGKSNNHLGQYATVINGQGDVHTYGGGASSKRQVIHSSSVKELLTECQFADLLIIRNRNFESGCNHYGQKKSMREILRKSGCPVLVIPDEISDIEQVLLIYDGSAHALNAIKTLRMTLNALCQEMPVTVIIPCFNDGNFSSNEEKMLIEYLRLHFRDLGIHKVCDESAHTLHFAVDPGRNPLLVINGAELELPAYLTDEIDLLSETNQFFCFQFLVPSVR